jgi:hypothetical protein
MNSTYCCSVCGYEKLDKPPYTGGIGSGSYEICPSCGFQFGVTDEDRGVSFSEWRESWLERGMPWSLLESRPPEGWNPRKQLQRMLKNKE